MFQRPILGVASYVAPPAFSDRWKGHFFVPFAPDGASEHEIQQRLANNSYGSIPTTSVHEAYPGHHWHLVMRKANASDVRRVYSTPYFSEGWALYAERVMRERGFFEEPIQELHHLNASLFRAARIIVDTSLHLGEMSYDEAVTFMMDTAAMPEPVAKAEVGRYCWWPTQASSYLTGCLEILAIRERWLARRGYATVSPARRPGRGAAPVPRHDHLVGGAAAGARGARGRGGRTEACARTGVPLLLDVDTGIDDALALLYVAGSPEAELVAVTCGAGNAALPDVVRNTRSILALAGRGDVEVAAGRPAPLVRPLEITPETHGPRGLGYAEPPEAPGVAIAAVRAGRDRRGGAAPAGRGHAGDARAADEPRRRAAGRTGACRACSDAG